MDHFILEEVLKRYGLDPGLITIQKFGTGLINSTWKISGAADYILQRINTDVFRQPGLIMKNLSLLDEHLRRSAPQYLFAAPCAAKNGVTMVTVNNNAFRMFPFIKNSHTVDFLTQSEQAYEAARQFGRFTFLLTGFDISKLNYTLPGFHDLSARVRAFNSTLTSASKDRIKEAVYEIEQIKQLSHIESTYREIIKNPDVPLRVLHHDTKISNVLFDDQDKGICVIDMDTVMPGYYISDVGDMMRSYLCEADEDEEDLSKLSIREDFFTAIYRGYSEQMGNILTPDEKKLFIYSGKFIIYMQAVRFLKDFLDGDIYYIIRYPGHNLVRARNQLRLLGLYIANEDRFKEIVASFG